MKSYVWALLAILFCALFISLTGCSPSSRPRANENDKPEWEELRQQFGM